MRSTLTLLLGMSLSGTALAQETSPDAETSEAPSPNTELRSQILDLLSAYETPASASDFQALGSGVEAELIAIAKDEDLALSKRSGAVLALGYVPSDAGRAYVDGVLADPQLKSLMRRQATFALATGWPEDNHAQLATALEDEDTQLRIAAAKALALSQDPQARPTLEARLAVEQNEAVKKHINASLAAE